MAKFNNKQSNNFITKSIQRYGPNFTEVMDAREMKNGAIPLFRDLARNKVDLVKHGEYLLDLQLLDNCLSEANSKLVLHSVNTTALNSYIYNMNLNQQDLETAKSILNYDTKCAQAYSLITNAFNAVRCTGNLDYIHTLVNNLKDYRNNI